MKIDTYRRNVDKLEKDILKSIQTSLDKGYINEDGDLVLYYTPEWKRKRECVQVFNFPVPCSQEDYDYILCWCYIFFTIDWQHNENVALQYFDKALEKLEWLDGEKEMECQRALLNFKARFYMENNQFKEAVAYFEEMLSFCDDLLVEDFCTAYRNIVRCLEQQNKWKRIINLGHQLEEWVLDVEDDGRFWDYNWEREAYVLVEEMLKKILNYLENGKQKALSLYRLRELIYFHHLSGYYWANTRRYTLAEKAYRKCFAYCDELKRRTNDGVLYFLSGYYVDFGNLLVSLQKYEEAEENYLKAISICTQEEQPEVAEQNSYNNIIQYSNALSRLGILYRNIKNYNKALEILGQAEDMLKEQNQESFEGYTEKIRNSWEFARVYAALNNHSKAKSYYLNTLELLDAQLVFAGRTMPEDTGKLIREAELYSEKAGDSEGVEYFQNYCFGPSGQKDTEEKEEDFEGLLEAAYNGNSDMQYKLGCVYYEGEGVVQSYKKAYKWFKLAANDGNPQAQFMVGLLNYSEENYKEAAKWFRMASRQGVIIAKTYLGIAFDVKKKTIHGNVGCNLINGGF